MDLIYRADYEQTNGRDDTTSTAEIPFIVLANGDPNAEDETQVRMFLEDPTSGLPTDYNDLPLGEYKLTYVGGSNWTGTARYSNVPPLVLGQTVWEFDGTGTQAKFLQSKETKFSTAVDASGNTVTAPDFKGCIGVTDDNIEGCDVTIPQALFVARKRWRASQLPSPTYLSLCWRFVGSTNSDPFSFSWLGATFTFARGELLLQGFSAVQVGDLYFDCSYKFAASINRLAANGNPLTIQGIPGTVDKRGWEYLWIYYRRAASNNVRTRIPQAVYVERVYDENLFDLLNIN